MVNALHAHHAARRGRHLQAWRSALLHGLGPARSSPIPAAIRSTPCCVRTAATAASRPRVSSTGPGGGHRGDNDKRLFTPEKSIQQQMRFGADVLFCLDQCTHPDDPAEFHLASVERTSRLGAAVQSRVRPPAGAAQRAKGRAPSLRRDPGRERSGSRASLRPNLCWRSASTVSASAVGPSVRRGAGRHGAAGCRR